MNNEGLKVSIYKGSTACRVWTQLTWRTARFLTFDVATAVLYPRTNCTSTHPSGLVPVGTYENCPPSSFHCNHGILTVRTSCLFVPIYYCLCVTLCTIRVAAACALSLWAFDLRAIVSEEDLHANHCQLRRLYAEEGALIEQKFWETGSDWLIPIFLGAAWRVTPVRTPPSYIYKPFISSFFQSAISRAKALLSFAAAISASKT